MGWLAELGVHDEATCNGCPRGAQHVATEIQAPEYERGVPLIPTNREFSDEEITELYRGDIIRLVESIARAKLNGQENIAESNMNAIVDIGYELVERKDKPTEIKAPNNIIRLKSISLKNIRPINKTSPSEKERLKTLAHGIAADLLNSIRIFCLAKNTQVPKISNEQLDILFNDILDTDKKLIDVQKIIEADG